MKKDIKNLYYGGFCWFGVKTTMNSIYWTIRAFDQCKDRDKWVDETQRKFNKAFPSADKNVTSILRYNEVVKHFKTKNLGVLGDGTFENPYEMYKEGDF